MVILEFSVSPLGAGESVSAYVARSLEIVEQSGLDYQLHAMGTLVEGELDQVLGGTCPTAFDSDVAQLEALMEQFTTPDVSALRGPHPTMGRLSDAAWLRWGYLHMDHHLRQFGV